MKKLISITAFCLAMTSVILAQKVPQGMKYQAVARNLKSEIIANFEDINNGHVDLLIYRAIHFSSRTQLHHY